MHDHQTTVSTPEQPNERREVLVEGSNAFTAQQKAVLAGVVSGLGAAIGGETP